MAIAIGEVEALFRFPVKSMRGEALEAAELDWHGVVGDRRIAVRRLEDTGGFPWLSASGLPELVLFTPLWRGAHGESGLPTHVRTPEGEELPIFGPELAAELGRRRGEPLQLMHMKHGVPDDGAVSVIASVTVDELGKLAAVTPDLRRYRPNIVIRTMRAVPFEEDEWVGGVLCFGEGAEAANVAVTLRDERCAMVNIDPDTAQRDPALHKVIVQTRSNLVGVYGTITRRGRVAVGQTVFFEPRAQGGARG